MLACLTMKEGKLPVRYLGVPLISKTLSVADCTMLMKKISGMIYSWLSKNLSFAGRLQLLSSVLYGMHVYWSSIFIFLKKIIRSAEQKFNQFLWNGNEVCPAKAKVSWELICVPKKEGGLGLKRIEDWNKAAILKHIWNLFTKLGSLWVAWVKMNLLKGRCF